MKYLFYSLFVFLAFKMSAQVDFDVTVLDSFITTTATQGVYGLAAQEYGGNIHLAYYYGSEDEKWFLIYEVRNQGQLSSREEVQEFSGPVWASSTTSIQFDESGNPLIYCSLVIDGRTTTIVFSKENNEWSPVDLDYFAVNTWLHSSGTPGEALGFVTLRKDFEINTNFEIIDYFSYEDGGWTSDIVSSSDYLKSQPASYHVNGETYVAFIEAHPPDTTVLMIYKKAGSQWLLDYQEVYPEGGYNAGGIAGNLLWQSFGYFNGEIHLLHNMDKSKTGGFTHLINSGGSWREVDFTNREGLVNGVFSGSELEFDSEGNAYWADGSDVVRGISKDQEYFEFEGSLPGYYYGCLDFEIKQDTLYMYHIAGDKNWPYGDAVLFFESIGILGASAQEGDDCEEAINIQSLLSNNPGEVNTSGVYDNTGYSPSSLADECFTIEQSIWYSFVGNGNRYNFTAIQCGADIDEYIDDSQVHIYSGDCNNLVFEDCNDDGGSLAFNLNFETEEGKQYYLIVDGYDTNEGQFCLEVTNLEGQNQEGDDCDQAFDIQSLLGNQAGEVNTSGVYDNTGYNPSNLADACYGLEQTIWFSFTGNGRSYNFTAIQCGADIDEYIDDSQVHIYSGDCNNLVFEDCNDDGATLAFDLDLETEQGKQYYLIVDGFLGFEGKFCLQVTETSTSSEENILQNINIYPNPALDFIMIEGFEGDRLELIDLTGKVIRSWTGHQQQLQLQGLPSGSYFLRMYDDDNSFLRKIVKL